MNGNISKDGIAKDMAWMKRIGIGGLQNFDANLQTPQIVEDAQPKGRAQAHLSRRHQGRGFGCPYLWPEPGRRGIDDGGDESVELQPA
jgi:hypothetical protein